MNFGSLAGSGGKLERQGAGERGNTGPLAPTHTFSVRRKRELSVDVTLTLSEIKNPRLVSVPHVAGPLSLSQLRPSALQNCLLQAPGPTAT